MYRIRWDRIYFLLMIIIGLAMYCIVEVEMNNGLDTMYYIKSKLILFCCLLISTWLYLSTENKR